MTIQLLRRNLVIQYCRDQILYGSEDHIVWKSMDMGISWQEVCRLPAKKQDIGSRIKDRLLRSLPIRSLRRNIGINNVVVLPTGTIIIQYDKIYRYDGQGSLAQPVFDLESEGVDGPLKNGLCYDPHSDCLYFGEYRCDRSAPIRVFQGQNDGKKWSCCYQFAQDRIRHVHAIVSDPYRKRLWLCSGDSDQESGLFYSDDRFRTLQLLGGGDQGWRMVSLLTTKEGLIWGSDAGGDSPSDSDNFIYHCNPKNGKRTQLTKVENPVYFGCRTRDGYWLSTTFEPHKRGSSNPAAGLWYSRDGLQWQLTRQFPYRTPSKGQSSSYGLLFLPKGTPEHLYATPLNSQEFHFSTLSIPCLNEEPACQ